MQIGNQSYELLGFRYRFHRSVDSKGRPRGGMRGGDILCELESTGDIFLLEKMLSVKPSQPLPVSGSIEVINTADDCVMRRLSWEVGYIYSVSESLCGSSSLPMTTQIIISPLRLDINRTVQMDRRWPQTYAFWWERYVPQPFVASGTTGTSDNDLIADAYWITEEGERSQGIPVGLPPVTLYIVMDPYVTGRSYTFTFHDTENEGWERVDCSGTANEDGVVTIRDFRIVLPDEDSEEDTDLYIEETDGNM